MQSADYYKENLVFPNRDIDPSKKTDKYCQRNSEVIYGLYLAKRTAWGVGAQSEFATLRRYSTGQQDTDQYKTYLLQNYSSDSDTSGYDDAAITRQAKRQGWLNVFWENLSPAPRILNALLGKLEDVDYDVYVDMIDSDSRGLMEFEKFKKFHEARDAKWQTEFKMKAGIPVDQDVPFPTSKEELESFSSKEGFKLNIAKSMQKLLRHSFQVSDWDGTVARKVRDDLLTIGYGAVRDYYDDEQHRFRVKWVDPARLVIQHSEEFDYRDSEYGGYFSEWTISNIRRKLPELSEDKLRDLANQSKGMWGNPDNFFETERSALDPSGLFYRYDDYKVRVFEAEWIDADSYKKLHYTSKRGRKSIIDLGYNSKVRELNDRDKERGISQELRSTRIRKTYGCHWIVGTDYVFDYGPINMAPRPQPSKPKMTFHVEQLLQPSLIRQLRTILDQIALTWLKHQNSIAQMVENGYSINYQMLQGISLGGKKLNPAELLKMWKQTGILLHQYNTPTGQYGGGSATPITPITGGMQNRIRETAEQLEILFGLIEKITGINPVALGASASGETTLGETEMSVQAMADVIRPVISAFFDIKESAAESLLNRIQIGIRVSPKLRKAYAGIASPSDIDTMKLSEKDDVMYGFQLKAKPDISMKRTLLRFIEVSLTNGRNGQPGLSVPEALDFTMRIERGEDIDQIRQDIDYAVKKAEEKAQMEKERMIQLQNEGNMQNQQMAIEGQAKQSMLDGQLKQQEEKVRGEEKRATEQVKGNIEALDKLYEDMMMEEGRRQTINK